MEKFWTLFEKSMILQFVLIVMVWATIAVLAIQHEPIPDLLQAGGGLTLGYFFAVKVNQTRGME